MRFQENIEDKVTLAVPAIEARSDGLTFTYTVTNGSHYRIYLVNQLFHRRGGSGFLVDPNLVYAEVDKNLTLYLRKQLIEVPEDLDVEAPEVPYVTPVAAVTSFAETVNMSFPIEPHDPYHPQPQAQAPYSIHQFSFSLGYLVEDMPVRVTEVSLPSGTKHWWIGYTNLLQRQRLKVIGPLQATMQTIASFREKGRF